MGYTPVPLIEALNGPCNIRNSIGDRNDTLQTTDMATNLANDMDGQRISPASSLKRSKEKINQNGSTDFRMSVLLANEENLDLLNKKSPTVTRSASNKDKKSISRSSSNRDRDSVKYINEKSASNVK
jgi:hypothetical protein